MHGTWWACVVWHGMSRQKRDRVRSAGAKSCRINAATLGRRRASKTPESETFMNMLPHSEPFRPHPNFDDAINRAICQSEMEGGVGLDELPVGTVLDVETANNLYR